jgi:hypothetical protein
MIRFLQTEGPFKKIVLSGLLLLICAAMAITLIPGVGADLGGAPGKGVIAKVNGEDITAQEVRDSARQIAQQQAQQYGQNAAMLMPFLMQQATQRAADQLINRQVLLTEAHRLGLKATPQEVKDELQHGRYASIFFPGGTFIGETEYQNLLQSHNLTPTIFEENVGQDLLIGKLQALVTGRRLGERCRHPARSSTKQNTKVKFEYAVLKAGRHQEGPIHPTAEELKAYYDQPPEELRQLRFPRSARSNTR